MRSGTFTNETADLVRAQARQVESGQSRRRPGCGGRSQLFRLAILTLAAFTFSWIDASAAFAACGNGTLEAGEWCDDGNTDFGDGCRPDCTMEGAAVAAGDSYSCALTRAGRGKCWGLNSSGQLGDGTTTQRTMPVDVSGLGSGVTALAAGASHTCALTAAGGVKCWGRNGNGQLGDGTTTQRTTPVDVSGLGSGVTAVAAGGGHTCALTAAGGVKCWGGNGNGQLGDGTTTQRTMPVDVSGLGSGVTAVATGDFHTCALTAAGGVKCWGRNVEGQLGDGTTTQRTTPVDVSGLGSGVTAVAAGDSHTCALTAVGGVKCWGWNGNGQLGDETTTQRRTTPVDVSELGSGVTALAAGIAHTCALTAAGGVKCWGDNSGGQLGDGTTTQRTTPVDVSELAGEVTALSAGGAHTCAVTARGGIHCWGNNASGQLGDGLLRASPTGVSGLASGVTAVAAGQIHTCALTGGGDVRCWGSNLHGQLGVETMTSALTPIDVTALGSGVTLVAVGVLANHTCALTEGGGMKCWGSNTAGQLGDGTTTQRLTPVDVLGLGDGVTAVAAGHSHTCALTTAGGVKCWGSNADGQLGDGTTIQRTTPVDVVGLGSGVTALAAGHFHTCVLTSAGGVRCWGRGGSGQLGDGTMMQQVTPVDVIGLSNGVTAVAAGGNHTCAVMAGGTRCWGSNVDGQLGDGTTTLRNTPVDVIGLGGGVVVLAAGGQHTCAVTSLGGVKCWGRNNGQLGDGTTTNRTMPVEVSGLQNGVTMVSTGNGHTCAVTAMGGAKCWGANWGGQLGIGLPWTPQPTLGFSPPLCGNATVDAGEQCDDGNALGGDCCDGNCQLEAAGASCSSDGHPCTDDVCDGSGTCGVANNNPCDDGDLCTQSDQCGGGVCVGSSPVVCTALGQCHDAGTCDPATGVCSNPFKLGGAGCDDGDLCTQTDTCDGAGACIGSNSVVCAAASDCHLAGTCDPGTGACSNPPKPAGSACPDDGNACTADQCDGGGVCIHPAGNAGTVCRAAAGDCDIAELCDGVSASCPVDQLAPASVVCRAAAGECDVAEICTGTSATCPADGTVPDGTACSTDGDPCTPDMCAGGVCVHSDADADGIGDLCDNCETVANLDQENSDCNDPDYFLTVGCAAPPANKAGCCDGGDVCDACPAQKDNANCDPDGTAASTVGPAGGTLATADGGVTVDIPPGALAAETSITVTENGPATRFTLQNSGVYSVSMRPENLRFDAPVTVTFTWADRDGDGVVDRGTCTGGADAGASCDRDSDCASGACSSNTNVKETSLVLKRNASRFSKGGFGANPYRCSDHLSGACAAATPDCNDQPGQDQATVANCCDPAANTWSFQTCSFSEFLLGLTAGDLVPGKGSPKTDCMAEWGVQNPLNEPYADKKGLPSFKQVCTDGDPSCDRDGLANGACEVEVAICLNVDDPRLVDKKTGAPACSSTLVETWRLKKPRPDSAKAHETANALALRAAVGALGSHTVGGKHQEEVSFTTPLTAGDECTAPLRVVVPLRNGRKGKAVFKMQTVAGKTKDTDKLKVTCLPPAP